MLLGSQNGRYEAHRSLCIRFLSRDHGDDDVIWSQIVMRVAFRNDVRDPRTIVCWNHVVDQREAVGLRQRSDELETEDVVDSSSGPPRPSTVVQMEEEEGLSPRATGISRRSPPRGGLSVIRDELSEVATSDTVHCLSSTIFSSGSAKFDEFLTNRARTLQGDELPEDFTNHPSRCVTCQGRRVEVWRQFKSRPICCIASQDCLPGSARHEHFLPNIQRGIRNRRKEVNAVFTTDSCSTCRTLSPLSARSPGKFHTLNNVRGETEVNANFTNDTIHCTGSQTFSFGLSAYDDCQENRRSAGRTKSGESSLPDDVTNKPSTSPAMKPATISVHPVVGTAFPYYSGGPIVLITPSPPMSVMWSHTMPEQQRLPTFYLPVLDAEEVEDVLDQQRRNAAKRQSDAVQTAMGGH